MSVANGTMVVAENTNSSGAVIVRPQTVGVAAEQQRVIAEVQAALTVAKASRRDEVDAVDRIKNACQRIGLAERAEYVYSRGGTEITGPTIDLLTVIANCWGNIQFGFRELSQANGESIVEAFAWDLETNSKRSVQFAVPHKRFTRSGSTDLKDPRDIYELVANQAQRRVRACLEAIIPPDVLEDAVTQCKETLKASADVTPETITKLLSAFATIGVTKEQIEVKLGRRIDTMQPAQYLSLRRIYKSISDGMSKPGDWFEASGEQPPATATEAAKTALKRKPAPEPMPEPTPEPPTTGSIIDKAEREFAACTTTEQVDTLEADLKGMDLDDGQLIDVEQLATEARTRLKKKK